MVDFDIVIPAFGRQDLLEEAIASVVAQTHPHWRLWVIDDASEPPLALGRFAHDARIRLFRLTQNYGPAYARNYGAMLGNAPYLAFLDSDDLWQPEKLQCALAIFKQSDYLWLHSNEIWLRDGKIAKQKPHHRKEGGQFFVRALERCLISPSAVVLRRSFFLASGGFCPAFRWCEDYELWLRLLLEAPIAYTDLPLVTKRAGNWPQLSQAREIDRFRVLALHRIWRLLRHKLPREWQLALLEQAIQKCGYLIRGALKYANPRLRRYQAWLSLFNTLRTRAMRDSSCAVSR